MWKGRKTKRFPHTGSIAQKERDKPGEDRTFFRSRLYVILLVCFSAVFVFSATWLVHDYVRGTKEENAFKKLATVVEDIRISSQAAPDASSALSVPAADPQEETILPQYLELYEQNTDMVGWIKIDGTIIDYPVMYTSGSDYYLDHSFDREKSKSGVPFIDKRCTVDPFGTNTIIYSHHMKNGTMFAELENYEDEDYYEEHPIICFDTLYAWQKYEIIAVFESRIFQKSDTAFKHYNFLNAGNEFAYNEYIRNIKALSLYDTGVTASYGDGLLTLVACTYHMDYGQFVVVAKKLNT